MYWFSHNKFAWSECGDYCTKIKGDLTRHQKSCTFVNYGLKILKSKKLKLSVEKLKPSVRKKVDLKLQWIKNVLQKNGSILIVLNSPLVMVENGKWMQYVIAI